MDWMSSQSASSALVDYNYNHIARTVSSRWMYDVLHGFVRHTCGFDLIIPCSISSKLPYRNVNMIE